MRPKALSALLGFSLAVIGLVLNFWGMAPAEMAITPEHPLARSLPDTLIWFWTYLTHLVTVSLALSYLADLSGWRALEFFRRPGVLTGSLAYILVVAMYYTVMIEPNYPGTGPSLPATWLLHKIGPVLFLLWWIFAVPRGRLSFRQVPLALLPGLVYVAWVLGRGAVVHESPYAIFDPANGGYLAVAQGVALVTLAVALVDVLLVFVDRLMAPRTAAT